MYEIDDLRYIESRVGGTVFRHVTRKDPVLVSHISGKEGNDVAIVGEIITGGDREERVMMLSELELPCPKLGFTNFEGESFYIGRFPKRRDWRQGLRADNMAVIMKLSKLKTYRFGTYTPLVTPFKGNYPSWKEVLERVEDIYKSCAFDRYFSLDEKMKIIYKNEDEVGYVDDNGEPVLLEEFTWLDEALREAVNGRRT